MEPSGWSSMIALIIIVIIAVNGHAAQRFARDDSVDSYSGSNDNSDGGSPPIDYDDYPYSDADFYNYPDFGQKHTKKKNTVLPKLNIKPRFTTTTTERPTTTTSTTTTTTTTTTTPPPPPSTTRRLYKYTRHRITTTTTTAPPPPLHPFDLESSGSYEIEEYDNVETQQPPIIITTSTRRPYRKIPINKPKTTTSTTTTTTTTTPAPTTTTTEPPRRRRKPTPPPPRHHQMLNSSSNRNEIRVRPATSRGNITSTYYEADNDPLIESASQHSAVNNHHHNNLHFSTIDHGYGPLQEYEYSFRTFHPSAERKATSARPSTPIISYERTSFEEPPSDRLLFSTDLLSHKYSAHDTDFGYFKPMVSQPVHHQSSGGGASGSTSAGGQFGQSSSGGFQPVHIDFASDLNVADLPLESFPNRLKQQFGGSKVVKKPSHHGTTQHHHQHQQQQQQKMKQAPNKLPSYYSGNSGETDDRGPASVLVYAETVPFIPSEQIGIGHSKPGSVGGGYDRFNQAALAAVASPEQIELYNNDLREYYESLIEKQLKNSPNPADRAKYHQFLKAKQDEKHEIQQAKRQQQQQSVRPWTPASTAPASHSNKPQFRPKRPYTTPGLRHYRKPGQPFASDRSYEFPFVK